MSGLLAFYERPRVLNLACPAFALCSCEYRSFWHAHVSGDFAQTDSRCIGGTDFSPGCVRDCPSHTGGNINSSFGVPSLTGQRLAPAHGYATWSWTGPRKLSDTGAPFGVGKDNCDGLAE